MHVSVAQAQQMLAELLPTTNTEQVSLIEALGRTLAADLSALVSHPSATESALDGIAARESDTLSATPDQSVRLEIIGESRAGAPYAGEVGPGQCVRIYTGAPLPPGTNAICPVEKLLHDGPHHVLLAQPAAPGDVRHLGADFHAGQVVLRAGTTLTAQRLALAAALGHAQVSVHRKLRVALLSTGDEVIPPGEPLQPGQVYDSNTVGLSAMLHQDGCAIIPLGHAPDRPEQLASRLDQAGGADLLLTSGGVSMGQYDFMRDLLIHHGQVKFWKIRMRPGGPALLGHWHGTPVLGLPGNPVSSLIVYQIIARPALTGQPTPTLHFRAATPFKTLPDKTAYWRATLKNNQVHDYPRQSSGILRSLSDANALVIIPEGQQVNPGDEVEVIML